MIWMVDFDDDMCPVRIHGFFQYKTSGLLTNALLGDGKSVEEIAASNEHNNSMYDVIHAAKNLNYSKIEDKFITSFQLGGDEKHHYIVSVDSIVGPLMAVPNFDGDEHCYITVTPYKIGTIDSLVNVLNKIKMLFK